MTKRRNKPHDPAASERIRRERAENAAEITRLRAQPSVTVNIDNRTGRLTGAQRINCFAALLRADGEEAKAIDWLDMVIRTAQGENTPERRPDHIRATVEGAPGQNVTADMIAAGEILVVIEEAMAPRDIRMLFQLLKPDAAMLTRWRDVVVKCTGETNPQAQGAAVRAAAHSLAYQRTIIDRLLRERRDRRRMAA